MTSRIPRIPRLILYSGPNCSLCDTAKAELAKVKRTVPRFSIRNYQHTRSGSKQVEKEIPVLDPSSSRRGEGGGEGEVGCPDGDTGVGQVGRTADQCGGSDGQIITEQCGSNIAQSHTSIFFTDDDVPQGWDPAGIYLRDSEFILGNSIPPVSPDIGKSRCFNCGSPDHIVSACPSPADRQVISLSRQLFNFTQASRGVLEFKRIHVVEEWRQKRLEWLEAFEPGEVRGSELKDALGNSEGDWLGNIAIWGYPRGWVSVHDPRDHVRRLIWNESSDGDNDDNFESDPFFIVGDEDNVETIDINTTAYGIDIANDGTDDTSVLSAGEDGAPSPDSPPKRWAEYPASHFSSQLLPTYNGFLLPPISHKGSSTYTPDRQELWQRIITGTVGSQNVPPWRLPNAFGPLQVNWFYTVGNIPPPPPNEPPPLPPQSPPPPPPTTKAPLLPSPPPLPPPIISQATLSIDDEDMDMDLSDSESD